MEALGEVGGQSHEAGGGATLDLRLLLSGRHPLQGLSPLILTFITQGGPTIPHFADEEAEAWQGPTSGCSLGRPVLSPHRDCCIFLWQGERFGEARREV